MTQKSYKITEFIFITFLLILMCGSAYLLSGLSNTVLFICISVFILYFFYSYIKNSDRFSFKTKYLVKLLPLLLIVNAFGVLVVYALTQFGDLNANSRNGGELLVMIYVLVSAGFTGLFIFLSSLLLKFRVENDTIVFSKLGYVVDEFELKNLKTVILFKDFNYLYFVDTDATEKDIFEHMDDPLVAGSSYDGASRKIFYINVDQVIESLKNGGFKIIRDDLFYMVLKHS